MYRTAPFVRKMSSWMGKPPVYQAACALLLCVTAIFWVRSLGTLDQVHWWRTLGGLNPREQNLDIESEKGGLGVLFSSWPLHALRPPAQGISFNSDSVNPAWAYPNGFGEPTVRWFFRKWNAFTICFHGFIVSHTQAFKNGVSDWKALTIPYWMLESVFAACFLTLWVRDWKARRKANSGRCTACSYDLRASGGRCPECGTVQKSAPSS
jgi:hypothetical protein